MARACRMAVTQSRSAHLLGLSLGSVGFTGMPVSEPDDTNESLEDLEPTARQTWWAVAVATAAFIAFVVVAPFAGIPLVQLNAFFPSLDAIVFVTDLVTAVLLYAQFSISRSRCASGSCLRLSLYSAHRHPTRAHIRGRVFSPRPPRGRPPDGIMAVYLLARRLRRGLAGVRCSEARTTDQFRNHPCPK